VECALRIRKRERWTCCSSLQAVFYLGRSYGIAQLTGGLALADSVSAVQASAEISADGNVRQQDKVNDGDWIDVVTLDGPGSYAIFFRNGVFNINSHVDCVATNVNLNNIGSISSLQINIKGPGGMVVNSVGANGLISTDFDLICSGD
jgi:hypothetical protein